ncbi:MAG: serine hydrolase [Lachnospiraceae bacterium]|nr:serine hydrolase [Lachnospiraceae bacterium]
MALVLMLAVVDGFGFAGHAFAATVVPPHPDTGVVVVGEEAPPEASVQETAAASGGDTGAAAQGQADGQAAGQAGAAADGAQGGESAGAQGGEGAGATAADQTGAASGDAAQTGDASAQAELPVFPQIDAGADALTRADGMSGAQAALDALGAPTIYSEGAIVINADTGEVYLGKNQEKQFFPASITKLMTGLLVAENASPADIVAFSKSATTNLESGAVVLGVSEGDKISVEDCLHGLLMYSANEVANGLAEHVAGSMDAFAALMNERAAALGATGTHFANANGLNDPNHYSTPHDMARIAAAAFANDTVRSVAAARTYRFPSLLKNHLIQTLSVKHKMLIPSDANYYPDAIGGKTGYTSLAGNTLVTVAQRDGTRLVAVVMKSSSTHYADTKRLLDYGFSKAKLERAAAGVLWAQGIGGGWYYYDANGSMVTDTWILGGGNWYFVGSDGRMATDTTTPDGYYVGADGVWVD